MTDWTAFAGITGVVLGLFLALARLSQPTSGGATGASPPDADAVVRDPVDGDARHPDDRRFDSGPGGTARGADPADRPDPSDPLDLPTGVLLFNVVLSQGLFATLLVFGAWWTRVPPAALGLSPAVSPRPLAVGVGFGVALWIANHLAGRVGARAGIDAGTELRAALAPDSARGWVALLFVVLPLVALFEEFLFRAALVGALSAGFSVSPWLLAVAASVAFAFGHGAQGRLGVLVTGVLGFALAAGFVLTGSLLVVVVAHYLVNALEFVVHERPGAGR